MSRPIRWLQRHRPEDLLLNGLLAAGIVGGLAVGYWAWRADSDAARPVVAGRVVTESPSSTRATTTTAPAPPAEAPPALLPTPSVLPDTGPAPTRRSRRGAASSSGPVVTAPPQVLVAPTTPPATAPATTTTRPAPTTTTTAPATTTTTEPAPEG